MADETVQNDEVFSVTGQPTLMQLVDYFGDVLGSPENLKKFETALANAGAQAGAITEGVFSKTAVPVIENVAVPVLRVMLKVLFEVLELAEPATDEIGKLALDAVLGDRPRRGYVPDDVGRRVIEKLAPAGGAVEPGIEGAANYVTTMVHLQMEPWLLGVLAEMFGETLDVLRGAGGAIHSVAELREIIAQVFGGGRITRRVLAPFIDAGIVAPARWHTNKQYRPELLASGEAIRQFLRGNWSREQLLEELARQGWSDDRIDAMVNAQRKFFASSDVRTFVDRQHWTLDRGIQHLRDQGYDEDTARDTLRLEGLRRFETQEHAETTLILGAYENRLISKAERDALLSTYVQVPSERALAQELADLRLQLNVKHLTPSQAEQCVKAGVLAIPDYRDALRREGYDEFSVTALELLLRVELDKARAVDDHRADLEADRAAEKLQRDQERAQKQADADRARALKRRGSIADLERAVVRGLIPMARLEEVLTADYDADTVSILLAGVDEDRRQYLEQQAAAADARKRAAARNIDAGTLEDAVLAGLLTVDEFGQRLVQLHFSPADAELLTAIVTAKKQDRDDATAKRNQAAQRAKIQHIDLGRFERLVRLGARTVDDYVQLLEQLGYDDGSTAAMVDLLRAEIAKDRAAEDARTRADAALRARGLSLEQFRRAVILGTKTVDAFNTFLVNQGFTADAVSVLVADVEQAADDAAAARKRRESGAGPGPEPTVPLSALARAARLGIVSVAVYQARLVAAGYTADDVAIEMELLATEISDVQAARARRDALEQQARARDLPLTTIATAVKKGLASLEDYRSRAATLGFAAEDVQLLEDLLRDELAASKDARARRALVEDDLKRQGIELGTLEGQVVDGALSVDAFVTQLEDAGVSDADAELLAGNL